MSHWTEIFLRPRIQDFDDRRWPNFETNDDALSTHVDDGLLILKKKEKQIRLISCYPFI